MASEVHTPLNLTNGVKATEVEPVENRTTKKSLEMPRKLYIRKVIESVVLCWGFIAFGLTIGVTGPTFIDLETLTSGTTDQVSFTFMGGSIPGFLGALCAGAVISKFNPWLLLAVNFIPFALIQSAVPWSRSITALAVLNISKGFFARFYDAGGNVTLLNIWGKDNGPWMQALHFLFGVGGLLGPVIAKPFIYEREESLNNKSSADNSSSFGNQTTLPQEEIYLNDIKVWIAYLITGIVIILVSVALLAVFLAGDRKFRQIRKMEEDKKKERQSRDEKCFRITIVVFVFCMALTYCVVEISYINFLSVFLVKHLGLSNSKAAWMNAAFWASFTAGRAIGILVTFVLSPQLMLSLNVFGALISLAAQPFSLTLPEWMMWLCVTGLGLSLSTTFATLITWTERYIKVEGIVGATFVIAGALADMAGPLSIGILFKKYGPGALMYFLFAVSILTVCLYVTVQFIAWRHGERERDPGEREEAGEEEEKEMLPVTDQSPLNILQT